MARLGGKSAILADVIYAISAIVFFAYKVGHFDWNSIASISAYLRTTPEAGVIWKIVNFGTALASFLAIAGVLALSDRLRPCQEGFVRWTSTLAIIGYSILAITNVSDYYMIQRLAASYPHLDPSAQSALESIGTGSLDPAMILQFSTLGLWFLVAGWVSLRHYLLPKPLAWLGFIAGIAALVFVIVTILEIPSLTMSTIVITLIVHPIWLIGTGLVLWRERR